MFKKLFISLLLSLTLLTSVFVKPALATSPQWYHSGFREWFEKVNDPTNPDDIFAERYTSAQVEWVFYGYWSFLLNTALGTELAHCVVTNFQAVASAPSLIVTCYDQILARAMEVKDFLIGLEPDNLYLADTSKGVWDDVFRANRPISGIAYMREKIHKMNGVQEVSAQNAGFGYEAAEPVRALWQAARNITYFFLILALVVMSFMVMFRVKTSPQAIITIQSTLPRLIVAIILVTFSYALAGLMIDLMYVTIGVMAGVLASSGLFSAPNDTWAGMYADLSGSQLGSGLVGMMRWYGLFFIVALFGNNVMQIANAILPGIGGILLFVIIYICWAIILIKIIWALVKNFVTILFLIAAGPFMILGGALGGGGVGGWLKTLAAHLAVYPAVGFMFCMAFFFLANSFPDFPLIQQIFALLGNAMPFDPIGDKLSGTQWVPPFTVIGTNVNLIWLAASLIILSMVPKIVDIIKGLVSGKPFAYGTAIGEAIAPGAGLMAGGFWGGANVASSMQARHYGSLEEKTALQSAINGLMNAFGAFSGGKVKR